MKKRLSIIFIILILLITVTGCGVNVDTVNVNAEPINVVEPTDENEDSELIQEDETFEETQDVDSQQKFIEETQKEYDEIFNSPEMQEFRINEMKDEKIPTDYDEIMDYVPEEITTEYNKRLEEKEAGIFYNPDEIISQYSGLSDSEIIKIVNDKYLELHNNLREELGLPLFEIDEELDEIATIRAEEASYFFTHTRPNGELCTDMIPLSRTYVGENIQGHIDYEPRYEDNFYEEIANEGFAALCNSEGHYKNITDKEFVNLGIDTYVIHYDDGVIAVYTAFEFSN